MKKTEDVFEYLERYLTRNNLTLVFDYPNRYDRHKKVPKAKFVQELKEAFNEGKVRR